MDMDMGGMNNMFGGGFAGAPGGTMGMGMGMGGMNAMGGMGGGNAMGAMGGGNALGGMAGGMNGGMGGGMNGFGASGGIDFSDMMARMKAVEAGEAAAPVTQGGGEPSLPVAAPAAYAPSGQTIQERIQAEAPNVRSHGASEREQEARPRPGKNLASPGLSLWRDPRNAQVTVVGFAVAPTKDVREGDLLKEVDGSKVKGRSLDDIQRMLTGKKDSRVEVTLKRGFFSVKLSLRRAVAVPE